MTEVMRILDQLTRAYDGDAWHGPPIRRLLADVTAERAAARPVPAAHTIWELVLHMTAWHRAAIRRLAGEEVHDLPPEEDWPEVRDPSEAAWKHAREDLEWTRFQLHEATSRLSDAWLNELVPGKTYSVYVLLHGVIQHDLYHAGQIALLKKA